MMHRLSLHHSITTRLLLIAVVPAALMFIAVTATLYAMTRADAQREMQQHGRMIASALAHSSRYSLMSGNLSYLQTSLKRLTQDDPSIACVSLYDQQQKRLIKVCQSPTPVITEVVVAPIELEQLPDLEGFELSSSQPGAMRMIGHVEVAMTVTPLLHAKLKGVMGATGLVLLAAIGSCIVGLILSRRLVSTFDEVMATLRAIRRGDFQVQFKAIEAGELGELQRTIQQMADSLNSSRHELERQVELRTQELKLAIERVQKADAEKRRLISHSNAMVEADRKRVAVEIHDHLGAALISVRLEASALLARAEAAHDEDSARLARRICDTVQSLYVSSRDIIKSLRPEVIDTLGLAGAIEEMVRHLDAAHPDCRFSFIAPDGAPDVRGEVAIAVYRVVQEACTNIIKHAEAHRAKVILSMAPDTGELCITVHDDGQGFSMSGQSPAGLGLIGMRERVAAIGGQLQISSSPGGGTTLELHVPIQASRSS